MLAIDVDKRLNIEDCNKHIIYEFEVEEGAKCIEIFFKYTPPYLKDKELSRKLIEQSFMEYSGEIDYDKIDNYIPLRNLLTMSVSSPKGWIGTAHRHLKLLDHYISEHKASYGFMPTKIISGRWSVSVAVYSILTEYVDIELRVEVGYD